mmetsp:Transcript_10848/g.39808  ORF Transcript_10848/g.39808 Transcript_10848/m.39808 type:complete len:99 (-) Transcript_10848:747-1043(-)|eukprot:scaffold467_cov403-Prasinococcus_capsulatus_cf.AAC.18
MSALAQSERNGGHNAQAPVVSVAATNESFGFEAKLSLGSHPDALTRRGMGQRRQQQNLRLLLSSYCYCCCCTGYNYFVRLENTAQTLRFAIRLRSGLI